MSADVSPAVPAPSHDELAVPDAARNAASEAAVLPRSSVRELLGDAGDLITTAWRLDAPRLARQVLLLLGTGLTGGVSMLLLVPIINAVASDSGGSAIPVPLLSDVDISQWPLWTVLLCVVIAVSVQALLTRAQAIGATLLQQIVVDRMRQDAFDAVLHARWTFVLERRTSDITEIVTSGAARSGSAFNAILSGSVTFVIGLATSLVSFAIAPALTIVILVGVIAIAAALMLGLRPAHSLGRLFGQRNRVLQAVMSQSMDSLRLVRAHDAAGVWVGELAGAFKSTREVQVANTRRTATIGAATSIGLVICASALILVALAMTIPAATIVVVLLLAMRMVRSVQALARSAQLAANTLPGVRDLKELTTAAREAVETPGTGGMPDVAAIPDDASDPMVAFDDVTFVHPSSGRGVRDLAFDVPAGRITALVGASGAGKSTTADLVLGLLTPQAGVVRVGGRPLTDDQLPVWRRELAYVPQETVLIPGTIRRNLTWSTAEHRSDDDCWAALRAAAADFVDDYPTGLDTEIGDRGLWLSGGQRQRLALARALLRRPRLLVLDEATSSLDEGTETAILDLVRSLAPAVTVLLIAHRTSTIDVADRVVRLHDGRVESVLDRRG